MPFSFLFIFIVFSLTGGFAYAQDKGEESKFPIIPKNATEPTKFTLDNIESIEKFLTINIEDEHSCLNSLLNTPRTSLAPLIRSSILQKIEVSAKRKTCTASRVGAAYDRIEFDLKFQLVN